MILKKLSCKYAQSILKLWNSISWEKAYAWAVLPCKLSGHIPIYGTTPGRSWPQDLSAASPRILSWWCVQDPGSNQQLGVPKCPQVSKQNHQICSSILFTLRKSSFPTTNVPLNEPSRVHHNLNEVLRTRMFCFTARTTKSRSWLFGVKNGPNTALNQLVAGWFPTKRTCGFKLSEPSKQIIYIYIYAHVYI